MGNGGAYEALRTDLLCRLQLSGIEPQTEPDRVRTLIRDVVGEYQKRAGAGLAGHVLANPAGVVERLERFVLHRGPLEAFLAPGAGIEEVFSSGDDLLYIDRRGTVRSAGEPTDRDELASVFGRLLLEAGRSLDAAQPIVDGAAVLDGRGRLTALGAEVTGDAPVFQLRLYTQKNETLASLVANDTLSAPAAGLLAACVGGARVGQLVSGCPGSGKTTLVNAELRAASAGLRKVICEDTPELSADIPNTVRLRSRPATGVGADRLAEVSLRDLVAASLRLRPDLLVVGEVRSDEAYELTRAANAGVSAIASIHSNSCREALQALVTTALMAQANVAEGVLRAVFARVFHVLVHLDREVVEPSPQHPGWIRHQVTEISCVSPLQGAAHEFTVEPLFVRDRLGAPLRWTGAMPPDDVRARLDHILVRQGTDVATLLAGEGAPAVVAAR